MNLLSGDSWIISVLPVALYAQTAKGRAQFLIEAGVAARGHALGERVLYGGAMVVFAVTLAHVTYRGEHGMRTVCRPAPSACGPQRYAPSRPGPRMV